MLTKTVYLENIVLMILQLHCFKAYPMKYLESQKNFEVNLKYVLNSLNNLKRLKATNGKQKR